MYPTRPRECHSLQCEGISSKTFSGISCTNRQLCYAQIVLFHSSVYLGQTLYLAPAIPVYGVTEQVLEDRAIFSDLCSHKGEQLLLQKLEEEKGYEIIYKFYCRPLHHLYLDLPVIKLFLTEQTCNEARSTDYEQGTRR